MWFTITLKEMIIIYWKMERKTAVISIDAEKHHDLTLLLNNVLVLLSHVVRQENK